MQSAAVSSRYVVGSGQMPLLFRSWRRGDRAPAAFLGHSQPTHSGNLVDLGEALCLAGFNVHAGDLRGHGASVNSRQALGHLDRSVGWAQLVDDMRLFTGTAFAGVPWEQRLVIAPNIAALLTLELLKSDSDLARNIVLISPPPNQPALWKLTQSFIKARALLRNADIPDEFTLHHVYGFLGAQLNDRRHPADVASADRAIVDALIEDPMAWPTPTLAYWMSVFGGFREAWNWPKGRTFRSGTRILIVFGSEDPMMGSGSFVRPMTAWFRTRGVEDISAHCIQGARSAVFLDERRLRVSQAILGWFHDGELPAASRPETHSSDFGELSSRMLEKFGSSPTDGALRSEELVELCYNAIQDEDRWTEVLYRIALSISRTTDIVESDDAEKVVAALMPHLDRSYELSRQVMTNAALGVVLQSVIERFDIGIAVVDNEMRSVHYNRPFQDALLRCGAAGSLPGDAAAVDAGIDMLTRQAAHQRLPVRERMIVMGGEPVGIYFRPHVLRQSGLLRGGPSGVIVLRKPHMQDTGGEDSRIALMQLAYGLTQQEANVALRVSSGHSPENISSDLGLSIHTIRTHLKRCYEKVGVQGQTELAARIMAGPIGWLAGGAGPDPADEATSSPELQ